MSEPKLTEQEWRYIQRVIGNIASSGSQNPGDYLAENIRAKLYHAIGVTRSEDVPT